MPELVDNIDVRANELAVSLTASETFNIPAVDLTGTGYTLPSAVTTLVSQPVAKLTNADLTSGVVGGSGTFDVLMKGFGAHLKDEFDKGRITGADYTRAYIALTESAMANAVQFLLGRDAAFWQAQRSQIDAYTATVQLETAKMQYASVRVEALTGKVNYALTKIKLSNESIAFSSAKYQLASIYPEQLIKLQRENANLSTEGQIQTYNLTNILPKQLALVSEQVEVQRSQTLNNRTDGTVITGSVGKQKDLYTQQITSYQRDAELKAAKLFTDAWITQKTIDEGLLAPTGFQNTSLDAVLTKVKTNNGLT